MILVDPRAGSGPLVDHPALHNLAAHASPQLESGDVSFVGNGPSDCPVVTIGVEVKAVSELVQSLMNGRANGIDGQFRQLAAAYDVRWLCFYGLIRPNPDTGALQVGAVWPQKGRPDRLTLEWRDFGSAHQGSASEGQYGAAASQEQRALGHGPPSPSRRPRSLPYDYLAKFLASPSFTSLNIATWHCVDIDEVALWLRALYEVWSKPFEQHRAMNTFDQSQLSNVRRPPTIKPPTKRELQVAVTASTFPSLGYERAWAAAAHFKSVRAMVNATPDEWAEIKVKGAAGKERRLGKVVAQAVEDAIT